MKTPIRNYRWIVVALLFLATTINYLDRQVIGLLKDDLSRDFNWSEKDYSNIVMAFSAAYALGLLLFGRWIDIIGTKIGYAFSIVVWSLAAMAHALATSTGGFIIARAVLGLGEAGNFPAAIKAVAEWFPKKERAFATGIFNSGTNIAAVIGPPLIAWIFTAYGWQHAFIWTGAIGFLWLILWWWLYNVPSKITRISQQEFQHIHSDTAEGHESPLEPVKSISWKKIIQYRQTWAFIAGKFLTDPIWWFYLFWIPSYFNTTYGLDLKKSAIHVSTVYFAASFGSILGGFLSGYLIKKGWNVRRARRISMLIFAFCVTPIVLARFTNDIWVAVGLISLAAAAHQAWSANIFTTVSDIFPKSAVSSVVGIGGMAGSVGGILFPLLIGIVLDRFSLLGNINTGYNIIFLICGSSYLVAWLVMYFLTRSIKRLEIR